MLTPEIKRGEIWYITYSDAVGSEWSAGRPLLVLTSQLGCVTSPVLMGVFLTTNPEKANHDYAVELHHGRRQSWAITNQVVSVDRKRFQNKNGDALEKDIAKVEHSILDMMGISREVIQDNAPNEKLEFDAEYYRRMYELTMDKLCDTAIELEQLKRAKKVQPVVDTQKVAADPKTADTVKPEPLDLNRVSVTRLWDIGLSTDVTDQIVKKRPFTDWVDFQRKVNMPSAGLQILKQKVFISAPEKKKKGKLLNINEATIDDLKKLGFGDQTALTVSRWLRLHGPVKSYEDLEKIKRMGKQNIAKLKGKITF